MVTIQEYWEHSERTELDMTDTTKPYINSGYWNCGVCASAITPYDLHGSPVERKDECPYCKRKIEWEKVVKCE